MTENIDLISEDLMNRNHFTQNALIFEDLMFAHRK